MFFLAWSDDMRYIQIHSFCNQNHVESPAIMCLMHDKMIKKKKKSSHRLLRSAAKELISICGSLRQRGLLDPIKQHTTEDQYANSPSRTYCCAELAVSS